MEYHEPVMVEEILRALAPLEKATVVDGTLGSGGHAMELARAIGREGTLVGLDRDPQMLRLGETRLREAFGEGGPQMIFAARPYEDVAEVLEGRLADAIVLDLGINSLQLERAERGFSFTKDGPLDGRFNPEEGGRTMADLINTASEKELASWLYDFGDERYSRQIARRIVSERKAQPFTRTLQLAELVSSIYPPKERYAGRIHPATRTFQALRMVVNDEMGSIRRGIDASLSVLSPGGRMAVLTFHSGEDRLVKRMFRDVSQPRPDPENPYSATTSEGIEFEQETTKVLAASDEEAERNPRSRSAKLRVIRRKEKAS